MLTECQRITELDGEDLLRLCEENPIIACETEERDSCAYKREYEQRLERYNIERLLRWPTCEACDCPLVVVRQPITDGGRDVESVGVWQNPGSYLPTWAQCLESGCVKEATRDGRCSDCTEADR